MNLNQLTILGIIICFSSCRNINYKVTDTITDSGKTDLFYIENLITTSSNLTDTIFYYRFSLKDDVFLFKEDSSLDIAMDFTHSSHDKSHRLKIIFYGAPASNNSATLKVVKGTSSGFMQTSSLSSKQNAKSTSIDFGITEGRGIGFVSCEALSSDEYMRHFVNVFRPEIYRVLKKDKSIRYTSISHLDGYFKKISMVMDFN